VRELVGPGVEQWIRENGLYSDEEEGKEGGKL